MFFIIQGDKPLYDVNFIQSEKQVKDYFLVHAALDSVDQMMLARKDYYLGQVKTDDLAIYAYVNSVSTTMSR